tara:strand:- start:4893 stop:5249 length:357 start_codon:yes stop_codon:yes gene_type:complete
MYTNFHDLKKPFEDKKVDVTIILPIYNPNDSWDLELEKNLDEIFELFKHLMVKVILVNDGTSFCILQKAKRLKNRFPDLETVNHIKIEAKDLRYAPGFFLQNLIITYILIGIFLLEKK